MLPSTLSRAWMAAFTCEFSRHQDYQDFGGALGGPPTYNTVVRKLSLLINSLKCMLPNVVSNMRAFWSVIEFAEAQSRCDPREKKTKENIRQEYNRN